MDVCRHDLTTTIKSLLEEIRLKKHCLIQTLTSRYEFHMLFNADKFSDVWRKYFSRTMIIVLNQGWFSYASSLIITDCVATVPFRCWSKNVTSHMICTSDNICIYTYKLLCVDRSCLSRNQTGLHAKYVKPACKNPINPRQ